jgi:hypothetical protein
MKRDFVDSKIGFSDAELSSYSKKEDIFIVSVLAWNESLITVTFSDVIRVLDNDTNSISAFCKVVEQNDFLQAALNRLYEEDAPSEHSYTHYQFLDNDDQPALEIVSGCMEISYT